MLRSTFFCLFIFLWACSSAMSSKLSPMIDYYLLNRAKAPQTNVNEASLTKGSSTPTVDVFLYVDEELTVEQKAFYDGQGIHISDIFIPPLPGKHPRGFHLAKAEYGSLPLLDADEQIVWVESAERKHKALNDVAAVSIQLDKVRSGVDGVTPRSGSGIRVAVLDTGFYSHTDLPPAVEAYDTTSGVGVAAWSTTVNNPNSDHGNHVAGTVLGRGTASSGQYIGMAPDAQLCFYKVFDTTTVLASTADIIEGIERARAVGCKVINMSIGGYSQYMDGSSDLCQAVDNASANGVAVVVAAGNEANDANHYSVDVTPGTTSAAFQMTWPAIAGTGSITMNIVWRDDNPDDSNIVANCGNLVAGETFAVQYATSKSSRGTQSVLYQLSRTAAIDKNYDITITNTASGGQTPKVHVYLWSSLGYFTSPDTSYTIGTPGIADSAITVGAIAHRTSWTDYQGATYPTGESLNSLASFSSRGPRIDGTMKPDVTAPGSMTISCDSAEALASSFYRIDNDGQNLDGSGPAQYRVAQGTSMASPCVAGAVACLLEKNPYLTAAEVKNSLTSTAANAASPNNNEGYGLINIHAALLSVADGQSLTYKKLSSGCTFNPKPQQGSWIGLLPLLLILNLALYKKLNLARARN